MLKAVKRTQADGPAVLGFMALSLAVWQLPLGGAAAILACAVAAGLRLGLGARRERGQLKIYALFILFWGLATFLLQYWAAPVSPSQAWRNALELSVRLAALAALTLDLARLLTPFRLAVVLARWLKPFFGRERANQAGIALAVMLRLLPQAWRITAQIRQSLQMRCRNVSGPRRMSLLAGTALRRLSQLAWQQSLALAGRDLDLLRADSQEQRRPCP